MRNQIDALVENKTNENKNPQIFPTVVFQPLEDLTSHKKLPQKCCGRLWKPLSVKFVSKAIQNNYCLCIYTLQLC